MGALAGLLIVAAILVGCTTTPDPPPPRATPRQTVVVPESLRNPTAPPAPNRDCERRATRVQEIIDQSMTDALIYEAMMNSASLADLPSIQTAYTGMVNTAEWMTTNLRVFLADCGQSYDQALIRTLRGLMADLDAKTADLRSVCRSDLAQLGVSC